MKKNMNLSPTQDKLAPLSPPTALVEATSNEWLTLQGSNPLIAYLNNNLLGENASPGAWQGARFSRSVYLYKETSSGFKVIVKFYQSKTGEKAIRNAESEKRKIEKVRSAGLDTGKSLAVNALGTWRGVLFLEYVEGLTLGDIIAVHRSQPGSLLPSIEGVTKLLAKVHAIQVETIDSPYAKDLFEETLKYTAELGKYGVIKDEPAIEDAIRKQISRWRSKPVMRQFTQSYCHGDATTTNFIITKRGEVVAIDWERLKVSDPAADIGRLLAEINHSLKNHGESQSEIESLEDTILASYTNALNSNTVQSDLQERVRFYQASSTLRIARNGWISRLERLALVARALAMLS